MLGFPRFTLVNKTRSLSLAVRGDLVQLQFKLYQFQQQSRLALNSQPSAFRHPTERAISGLDLQTLSIPTIFAVCLLCCCITERAVWGLGP